MILDAPSYDDANPEIDLQFTAEKGDDPERGLFDKGTRITGGQPRLFNLVDLAEESKLELNYGIRVELGEYEFHLLRLVFTIHPLASGGLEWLDYHVQISYCQSIPPNARQLQTINHPNQPVISGKPIAYDLFPNHVSDSAEVQTNTSITPSLAFGETAALSGTKGISLKYQQQLSRVRAYQKGESKFYWRFTPGRDKVVHDGFHQLDAIIKRKKNTMVQVNISIDGKQKSINPFRAKSKQGEIRPYVY